jgi:hypothetical protein
MLLLTVWAALALYFDLPVASMRMVVAAIYLAAWITAMVLSRGLLKRMLISVGCFAVVLAWWLTLRASNEGQWQADVAQTAYADIQGSLITFHNVRNCDYRAELDYTCEWKTRQIDLNRIQGVDLFMDYWGSPWIAHTILSFTQQPGPDGVVPEPISFSIEARKQAGQSYSSVRGFFRQYTLISVVSEERDVVRLRTNYRRGEDIYLFHTEATPEFARSLLLDYANMTNQLHEHPQWYNAVTRNCTTEIFTLQAMKGRPKDWRILFNGKADEMLYNQDELATNLAGSAPSGARMSFQDLKRLAYINPAAQAADKDPNFSRRIREGRPGFSSIP